MTGLSLAVAEQFSGKWLELLKEAAPQVSRVAYLWNPANHSSASSWKAMQGLAPRVGLTLQSVTSVRRAARPKRHRRGFRRDRS